MKTNKATALNIAVVCKGDASETAHKLTWEVRGGPTLNDIEATLGLGNAGWYVEWFQEDDSTPLGFRVARWYGTREACEIRIGEPPPELLPAQGGGAGPHDAATAAGIYD